jgi:hypothetical protein
MRPETARDCEWGARPAKPVILERRNEIGGKVTGRDVGAGESYKKTPPAKAAAGSPRKGRVPWASLRKDKGHRVRSRVTTPSHRPCDCLGMIQVAADACRPAPRRYGGTPPPG